MAFRFGTDLSSIRGSLRETLIRAFRPASSVALLVALSFPSAAQIPNSLKGRSPTPAAPERSADPLGRGTPRGTVSALIRALNRDDFALAARYMQVKPNQRPNAQSLAGDLKELLDRYFSEPLAMISDAPTGAVDDGLPLDQERVGPLKMEGGTTNIILVRVTDPEAGPIWLISSDTLAQVPALHASIEKTWLERVMPTVLLEHKLFGLPLAQSIAWAASLAGPFLVLWLFSRLWIVHLRKVITDPMRWSRIEVWNERLRWPIIILLTLIVHFAFVSVLASSLSFRIAYIRFGSILAVLAFAWLLRRVSLLLIEQARAMVKRRGQAGTESLILLGQRVLNVFIAVVAIFAILSLLGIDTKTALAGIGIGGVAIAFGAQKTVENLLGGVFLLTDKALAVGDTCCISNRVGTVEDITLRSVRLRTTEQTLLSIPAGALSQANIENFATRRKILVQTRLQLAYGPNAAQLKSVLDGIQHLLENHPDIERETAYIRLVNFGANAIEVELFVYFLTSNGPKFLALRESLLLEIAEIVESAGSGFAKPTQFLYLEPSPGVDTRRDKEMRSQESAEATPGIKTISKRAS